MTSMTLVFYIQNQKHKELKVYGAYDADMWSKLESNWLLIADVLNNI